jgi:hypothetical protein
LLDTKLPIASPTTLPAAERGQGVVEVTPDLAQNIHVDATAPEGAAALADQSMS